MLKTSDENIILKQLAGLLCLSCFNNSFKSCCKLVPAYPLPPIRSHQLHPPISRLTLHVNRVWQRSRPFLSGYQRFWHIERPLPPDHCLYFCIVRDVFLFTVIFAVFTQGWFSTLSCVFLMKPGVYCQTKRQNKLEKKNLYVFLPEKQNRKNCSYFLELFHSGPVISSSNYYFYYFIIYLLSILPIISSSNYFI